MAKTFCSFEGGENEVLSGLKSRWEKIVLNATTHSEDLPERSTPSGRRYGMILRGPWFIQGQSQEAGRLDAQEGHSIFVFIFRLKVINRGVGCLI